MDQKTIQYDSLIDLLDDLDREGIQGLERQEIYKRFLGLRARVKGQPYSGGFELTPLCNFDCKMCYVHLTKGQAEKEAQLLTTEQWIRIMAQAIDAGMMHADLTGGECLSYPGFKEVYLYLVSRGVKVSILTNGQLLTDEMADFFKQYPPVVVQITLYGSDNDAYEQVTGRRAFDDVLAAIKRLQERRIKLFVATTPSRYMQEDTHALLELLRSLGVSYGIGTGSLPARPATERKREEFAPETALYVKLHLDEAEYKKKRKETAGNELPVQKNWIDRIPAGLDALKIPCASGTGTFHINWKGEMQPCIPFDTVKISVMDKPFGEAWAWIKKQMQAYESPKECAKCPERSVCVGCPGERTLGVLNGPLNTDVCDRFRCYQKAGITRLPSPAEEYERRER